MNIEQNAQGWWGIAQDTHVWKWICESGGRLDHDRHLHDLIENLLTEKAKEHKSLVAIDAGALYGDTTIGMCRALSNPENSGCVIAIEANPMAFECLSRNAKGFQSPTILINAALSDEHNGRCVHVMEENVGASKCSIQSKEKEPSKTETTIPVISIDGLCIESDLKTGFQFLKLDVEGFEMRCLRGARNSISRFKPLMVIEMNSFALSLQGSCYKDIYDFLISPEINYSFRIIQPEAVGSSMQYDILCWPNPEKPKLYKAELLNPPHSQ